MKIILSSIFCVLLLMGCDDLSNITSPIITSEVQNFYKITDFDYELIPIPPKSPLWIDSILTVSQIIDGNVGGRIIMDKYYMAANGDSIIIQADLRIPPGAFTGTETITLTVDNEYAAIHFSPSMVFADTLKFSQSFNAIDLSNYATGTLDFVFIDEEGNIDLIKKNGLQINLPQGFVRVINAKLLHFSRYGWIRMCEGSSSVSAPVFD